MNKRDQYAIFFFISIIIIIGLFGYIIYQNRLLSSNIEIHTPAVSMVDTPSFVIIHVTGEVQKPGVYKIHAESRVIDAIKIAGGPTSLSDLDRLNLARIVMDGEKIIVPKKIQKYENNNTKISSSMQHNISSKFDINIASIEEFKNLPGVGDIIAKRMVAYSSVGGVI